MSVVDPKPFLFTPIAANFTDKQSTMWCKWSKRYDLPCGTDRSLCDGCYMKQQGVTDRINSRYPEDEKVVHVCDRCGKKVVSIDRLTYLSPENRRGQIYFQKELCYDCTISLYKWMARYMEPDSDSLKEESET